MNAIFIALPISNDPVLNDLEGRDFSQERPPGRARPHDEHIDGDFLLCHDRGPAMQLPGFYRPFMPVP